MPEWEEKQDEEVEIEFTEPVLLFAIPPPDSDPPPPDSEFPPDDHFDIADAIEETLSEAPPAPRESGPVLGEYFKTAC